MRERLTTDQAVHTLLIVVDTVKVGLPSVAASTSSMTVHTKPSIASDFRYPSIKLSISQVLQRRERRLTRRTPYASFRNIAAPLPISYGSTDVRPHTYTDCSGVCISAKIPFGSRKTYAFLPIHLRKLLVSIYHETGMKDYGEKQRNRIYH
jgi:hypothetical protein